MSRTCGKTSPRPLAPDSIAGTARRSQALDILRGVVISILIVLVFTPTTGWRGHAEWWGWRPSDFFFPLFLFVAGAGVAYQSSRRGIPWCRVARRVILLVVLGLFVNWWAAFETDAPLRFTGVLQRIALVSAVGTVTVWLLRLRWVPVLIAAVACCLAWAMVLTYSAASCPDGLPSPDGCGTLHELDQVVLSSERVYAAGAVGHDPEGLASSLGALGSFLGGFAAAALAYSQGARSTIARALSVLAMGIGWLALTPVFLLFQPMGKRMWTASFTAVHLGFGLIALAVLMVVFDRRTRGRVADLVAWPLEGMGRNVLLLWLGLFVLDPVLKRTAGPEGSLSIEAELLARMGPVLYGTIFIGLFIAVGWLLHKRRWYLRL